MRIKTNNLGFIEGWLSVFINTILFALKLWVGIISNSVAMIADAWHTLSDTFTSVIVIFGFWISKKPPDEKHPFGHGRAELISATAISILLAVVGINFIMDSINQLKNHQSLIFGKAAIIVFVLSIFIKEGLAQFSIWAGKKIESKSLIADGWHHRSDAIASGLIVIGGLLGRYFWWIDGVLGLIISLLIFKVAVDIFRKTSDTIMGEKMQSEIEMKIKNIIQKNIGENYIPHHFHIHSYLNHKEITFHLYCPLDENISEIHEKIDSIERIIRNELQMEAIIHVEPSKESLNRKSD
jgi:cation diffusion facilitator family transporter